MTIEGDAAYIPDDEFKKGVGAALDLLKEKAGANHAALTTLVVKIVAADKSGADVYESIVQIARPTFDSSPTWLASVLVHEAGHIAQYRAKKKWTGVEAELECNRMQLETLRLVGAPAQEINHALAQTGTHFDLNGDGKFNRRDYELRTY